jgi:hypothetical protein
MQKISTYLYPNRIELLADLAAFSVEFTTVYQRPIKIYKGVDSVIEFDIKNADQKRIDLVTAPASISAIKLHVTDAAGKKLPNSPYDITPVSSTKGIATAIIPAEDLAELTAQYLRYSVTCTNDTAAILLYGDTRFGAVGTLELAGDALPITRPDRIYDTFTGEIDLRGYPIYHSSAIPTRSYEAIPKSSYMIDVDVTGFTGSIWVEGTKQSTINAEAFKNADFIRSVTLDDFTGTWSPAAVNVDSYEYLRVSYASPMAVGIGANFRVVLADGSYSVEVRAGGTGYAVGSKLRVLGSLIGGLDGINDLTIEVTQVDGASTGSISSYSVSSILEVEWTGTASESAGIYIVTGTNITGNVDKVTVS